MQPTTIPTEEIWRGATRFIAMPPDGDMMGENGIEPVEMLKGQLEGTDMPFHAMRFKATPEEAERLAAGEPIWLVYFFPYPIPVALDFTSEMLGEPPEEPDAPPSDPPSVA